MTVEDEILCDLLELAVVEHGQRVLHAVDRALLEGGVGVAERHRGRHCAEHLEALNLDCVVRNADLEPLQILHGVYGLRRQRVTCAVDPVRAEDLQPLALKLLALVCIPLALDELPALVPVVKEERAEDNAEILYAAIRVECAVRKRHNWLPRDHLIDEVILAAELARGIGLDGHRTAGLLFKQLLPLVHALIERLARIVLVADLDDDLAVLRRRLPAAAACEHGGREKPTQETH